MKNACLVFMLVICVSLMPGTSYPAPLSQASQPAASGGSAGTAGNRAPTAGPSAFADARPQADGRSLSDPQKRGNGTANNRPRSLIKINNPSHPKPLPGNRKHFLVGNDANSHLPASGKGVGGLGVRVQNQKGGNAASSRKLGELPTTGPSLSQVRHRGPNPAVIGGVQNAAARNPGTLDGTRMSRRP